MRKTAKENNLAGSKIVFLTNVHPDKPMGNLILSSKKKGIEIKDVYQTALFLFDEYYPFEQLTRYFNEKSAKFAKENWPYDIDEKTFVENFDFLYGKVLSPYNKRIKSDNCLSFISKKLLHGPVICVGYYGMGKTTISKMLFKRWLSDTTNIFPVFIALTHRKLGDFSDSLSLSKQVADEIKFQHLSEAQAQKGDSQSIEVVDYELFIKNIGRMVENKKVLLIFDGIDESIGEREDVLSFLDFLFRTNLVVFLTSRLEYRPFFDSYQALTIDKTKHQYIELCEWKIPQWETYTNSLSIAYSNKKNLVDSFKKKLESGVYSNLPGRPLFLKMLSDLEINNETSISIMPSLSNNLAEIYFKFIQWKIVDDYNRKGGLNYNFDREEFEKECFQLLKELACLEYQSTYENKESQVTLEAIMKICFEKRFIELSQEYIKKILLKSSLFAILRRTTNDTFIFSHKSFMEYLVASCLADCLFPKDQSSLNAKCDDVWNFFQTHEVSRHFVNEVERLRVTLKLSEEDCKSSITNAFKKIVEAQLKRNLMELDERFQEVLYYIGKLKITSDELVNLLLRIIENKNEFNLVYFRSASLALSRLKGNDYCEKYVLYILENRTVDDRDFKKNQEIQLKYYGEATLRPILKRDIDEYIAKNSTSSIISLKILTYFTSIQSDCYSLPSLLKYLKQVNESSAKQGHLNVQKICQLIYKMLDTTKI